MRIVFKQEDDGSPDLTFVEIEDDTGRSIEVGEWSDEGHGFRVLTLPSVDDAAIWVKREDLILWRDMDDGSTGAAA